MAARGGWRRAVDGALAPLALATLVLATLALAGPRSARAADAGAVGAAQRDLLQRPAPTTTRGASRLLLDIAPGGPGLVAVGEMGLVLSSSDGRDWRQQPSPTSVMLTAVHFVDAARGLAVGHDGVVLLTTDGGRQWERRLDGSRANAAVLQAARDAHAAALAARAGGDRLAQVEDQLASAEDAVKAGPSRPLMAVRFADARRAYVAGAFGQLFISDDGGQDWRYIGQRLPNPEGLHLYGVTLGAGGAVHIAAEQGVVFSSSDGGQTWRRGETGYAGNLYGVVLSPDTLTLLAYGFNGRLFRSSDGGASWSAVASRPSAKSWIDAQQVRDELWLLDEDGRLFVSGDGGERFMPAPSAAPPGRRYAGFAPDPSGERLVAVGQGGVGRIDLSPSTTSARR